MYRSKNKVHNQILFVPSSIQANWDNMASFSPILLLRVGCYSLVKQTWLPCSEVEPFL